MVHKWMTLTSVDLFAVISPAVRLDFLNYYLGSCRSSSTGLIVLNNLLSCANVNCKTDFSSVPDSLKLVWVCVELSVDRWIPLDSLQLDATLTVPGEANLSLLCQHSCISGVPVSTMLCRFVGKAQQQFLPITFSLKLSPFVPVSLLPIPGSNCPFAQ